MVIRIVLTIIFAIIAYFNVNKLIVKEVDDNPYIRKVKGNKLKDLLFSAIPYALFKILVIYAILMVVSVMFLQSKCTTPVLIDTYKYDTLAKNYTESNKKNANYVYEFDSVEYKLKNIDKVSIENSQVNYIELYELKSDNAFINILLYGMFERQIVIYGENL